MRITALSPGVTRGILTLYFYLVFLLIRFFSDKARRALARYKFYRDGYVPVSHLTGWLSGFDILSMWGSMRSLPGGWSGSLLMGFSFVFEKLVPLAVTVFVTTATKQAVCSFSEGLVVSTEGPYAWSTTPQSGTPFLYAYTAQLDSGGNDGLIGIYNKVQGDDSFAALESDLITFWYCTEDNATQSFPFGSNQTDVEIQLIKMGLLYPTSIPQDYSTTYNEWPFNFTQFVTWNWLPSNTSSFEVRAALQSSYGDDANNPTLMDTFHCFLDDPRAVNEIAQSMNISNTFLQWVPGLQGLMYTGDKTPLVKEASLTLAMYLNSMFMVQGGNASLLGVAPTNNPDYGCLVRAAEVPPLVSALVFIFTVIAVVLAIAWLVIAARHGKEYAHVYNVPYGLKDWMMQAGRERDYPQRGEQVAEYNARSLGTWQFTAQQDGRIPHIMTGLGLTTPIFSPRLSTVKWGEAASPMIQVHQTDGGSP